MNVKSTFVNIYTGPIVKTAYLGQTHRKKESCLKPVLLYCDSQLLFLLNTQDIFQILSPQI